MENMPNWKYMIAAVGGVMASLYGGWPAMMNVLMTMMAADYLTGVACAVRGKSPKTGGGHFLSSVAFSGLLKKGAILLVVLVAVQLDRATGTESAMFQTMATFFYIANEGMSIVENCGLLGVPVPGALENALEALRDRQEETKKN